MLLLTLGELISTTFISIGIWIVGGIYSVAAFTFEIFIVLASGKIVDPSAYQLLITNFYVVLGVVMLFFLSFILLKNMVNPDGEKGGTSVVKKVIINLVTSSIMLAVLPTAFSFLFDFQDAVIVSQNTIGKFFGYGAAGSNNIEESARNGAFQIANGVFTAFFAVDIDQCHYNVLEQIETGRNPETGEPFEDPGINWDRPTADNIQWCEANTYTNHPVYNKKYDNCGRGQENNVDKDPEDGYCDKPYLVDPLDDTSDNFAKVKILVEENGNFGLYQSMAQSVNNGRITFNFLLAIAGGCLLIYVGISYCIDMAIRLAKLCFYQLIAPIPIFMRVLVDTKYSSSFNQWLKVTLTCYGEVYIRVFLLYMVVFLTKAFMESNFFAELTGRNWLLSLFAKAFALVGLILFMKQAPKAFSEATGLDSGNMKIGIKDRLKEAGVFAAGAAIGGGVTSLTRNAVNAFGDKNRWKNKNGKVTFGSVLKNTGRGIGSVFAGGISGGVRSGKAGKNAAGFGDMKNAASSGARAAVSARDKRASYKAEHGDSTIRAALGHVSDSIYSVGRWAGINNIESLQEENASIDLVSGKVDKVVDNARETIRSQFLNKGKTYGFGVKGHNSAGISYDANTYRKLSDLKDRATTTGQNQDLSQIISLKEWTNHFNQTGRSDFTADEIQRIFGKYENDYAKQVANTAFMGNKSYGSYLDAKDAKGNRVVSYDEEAAMSAIRSAAEDARHELQRSLSSGVIKEANEIATTLAREKSQATGQQVVPELITSQSIKDDDLKVTDDTALDKFGTAAKIVKNKNNEEISKLAQKEKDAKK